MYYFALLLFALLVLSACVTVAAWATKTFGFGGVDPAFLGALIGAAGTIFAATVAYVAVQKQIDTAKEQAEANLALQQKFEKQQAENYLIGLKTGRDALEAQLQPFAEIPDQDANAFRDTLFAMMRAGTLKQNIMAMMPNDIQARTQDFLQRMSALRFQMEVLYNQNMDPAVRAANRDWAALNTHVRDAVLQGRRLVDDIKIEVKKRETPQ